MIRTKTKRIPLYTRKLHIVVYDNTDDFYKKFSDVDFAGGIEDCQGLVFNLDNQV